MTIRQMIILKISMILVLVSCHSDPPKQNMDIESDKYEMMMMNPSASVVVKVSKIMSVSGHHTSTGTDHRWKCMTPLVSRC